ncbi:MAG: alpha/beta fold hydrolase [Salaquimonas sp.]
MFIKILTFILTSVAIYFVIALVLIFSQSPSIPDTAGEGESNMLFEAAIDADYSDLPELVKFSARDRAKLGYRFYQSAAPANRMIILVHGSSWHGMQFHKMATAFSKAGLGHVILPDLRGHGPEAVTRGTIDHISQLEEDMADMIDHLKLAYGGDKEIVLGGHSSGGGFVVRFASGGYGEMADRIILLAPFLKYDAPTTKPDSGNWAFAALRRIIGLSMLNGAGIHALDHLPVIKFNMPKSILESDLGPTATVEYSHALNTGIAPRFDFTGDLSRIKQSVLLIVGSEDEAFYADQYEPLMSQYLAEGQYKVLDGVNHIGLVFDEVAIKTIAQWME